MKKPVRRSSLSVGGNLSIIMSLLLAVQPALGAFEGVKKKAVSVKEAMARSRAALKENWQCFRSGTGPNCTKEQRSALRIIQDFVTGKWAKAREELKKFYAEHRVAISVGGITSIVVLAMLLPWIVVGGINWKLTDSYRKEIASFLGRNVVPSKPGVDVDKVIVIPMTYYLDDENIGDTPEAVEFIHSIQSLRNTTNLQEGMKVINDIDGIMKKLGWNTTFGGINLIDMIHDNTKMDVQDKEAIINELKNRGVNPTKWKYPRSQ